MTDYRLGDRSTRAVSGGGHGAPPYSLDDPRYHAVVRAYFDRIAREVVGQA